MRQSFLCSSGSSLAQLRGKGLETVARGKDVHERIGTRKQTLLEHIECSGVYRGGSARGGAEIGVEVGSIGIRKS
jgi:hypothetical protein